MSQFKRGIYFIYATVDKRFAIHCILYKFNRMLQKQPRNLFVVKARGKTTVL